ncbi:MAG: hypothetical protein M0007_10945 [Actinomycetota bacterium]|jgi:hypothetical protein|nr:hypothetical protein [Actinomycetota bacterium]
MAAGSAELEALLVPGYLDGIGEKPLEEIRRMRGACQEAEVGLSYVRRLSQGRLDIVLRALDHRRNGDPQTAADDLAAMVEELPQILAAGPHRPPGPGRLPMLLAPDTEREDLTARLDAILDADGVGRLAEQDEATLQGIASRLSELEAAVSADRRLLHERIDSLQAEIVRRYKTGSATVEGLLS